MLSRNVSTIESNRAMVDAQRYDGVSLVVAPDTQDHVMGLCKVEACESQLLGETARHMREKPVSYYRVYESCLNSIRYGCQYSMCRGFTISLTRMFAFTRQWAKLFGWCLPIL